MPFRALFASPITQVPSSHRFFSFSLSSPLSITATVTPSPGRLLAFMRTRKPPPTPIPQTCVTDIGMRNPTLPSPVPKKPGLFPSLFAITFVIFSPAFRVKTSPPFLLGESGWKATRRSFFSFTFFPHGRGPFPLLFFPKGDEENLRLHFRSTCMEKVSIFLFFIFLSTIKVAMFSSGVIGRWCTPVFFPPFSCALEFLLHRGGFHAQGYHMGRLFFLLVFPFSQPFP